MSIYDKVIRPIYVTDRLIINGVALPTTIYVTDFKQIGNNLYTWKEVKNVDRNIDVILHELSRYTGLNITETYERVR